MLGFQFPFSLFQCFNYLEQLQERIELCCQNFLLAHIYKVLPSGYTDLHEAVIGDRLIVTKY